MTFGAWARKYNPVDLNGALLRADFDREQPMNKLWTVLFTPKGWKIKNGLRSGAVAGYMHTTEPFPLDAVITSQYNSRTSDELKTLGSPQ